MTKDNAEYKAKTENGAELVIKHDGFHYRAIGANGAAFGQPFVKLADLLTATKAELAGASNKPEEDAKAKKQKAQEEKEADELAAMEQLEKEDLAKKNKNKSGK